jgi:DNA-binding transcriptional LysR family regulator
MELHQLRYLVAVVDDGSFTAAAERLHVSQSGVSAQVAKLERELGQRLLSRGPRALALTAAGEAVLPLARQVLGLVEQVGEVADELSGVVRGRVRLGMIRGCSIPPFLDALAAFRSEHPGVELVLAEDDSDVLMRRVLAGELDLALVGWAGDAPDGLALSVVVDEPVAAVVPAGHRLARRSVRWADLAGETLLALTRGTGVRAAVDASHPDLPIALEAGSPDTVLGLVTRGAGVALLSGSMVRGVPDVVAVPVRDAAVTAKLGLAVRRDGLPSATRALHERILAAMG